MNIPFAKSTSNPSGIPYRVCFLINFHAPSRDIWQLYRPHDEYSQLDRTLLSQHQFSIFPLPPRYGEETRVFEKREEVGSREMVLIGSRIANESLKFALVTCSFRREMFPWGDEVEDEMCVQPLASLCIIVIGFSLLDSSEISLLSLLCEIIRFKGDMKKKKVH